MNEKAGSADSHPTLSGGRHGILGRLRGIRAIGELYASPYYKWWHCGINTHTGACARTDAYSNSRARTDAYTHTGACARTDANSHTGACARTDANSHTGACARTDAYSNSRACACARTDANSDTSANQMCAKL